MKRQGTHCQPVKGQETHYQSMNRQKTLYQPVKWVGNSLSANERAGNSFSANTVEDMKIIKNKNFCSTVLQEHSANEYLALPQVVIIFLVPWLFLEKTTARKFCAAF